MSVGRSLVTRVMLAPLDALDLSALEWDLLIRQGRRSNLLAELGWRLTSLGGFEQVPPAPRMHLLSAMQLVAQQDVAVRHEVALVLVALQAVEVRVTFLKGAGYLMAGLPLARGRVFSDVDVLVPKNQLHAVETALRVHGWQASAHEAYDQRYYRLWMHELPPMSHVRRGTTIDVHHTILPETARLQVNTQALLEAVVPLPGEAGVFVLPPLDMLLHSATHLFHEGEFDNALRDLFDLDAMLRSFGSSAIGAGFWDDLVARAAQLGLARPLYYALRYTTLLLDTPVPDEALKSAAAAKPAAGIAWFMDACYVRALQPVHSSTDGFAVLAARFALYLRSHWIRMPLHLLLLHLGRKALMRLMAKPIATPAPAAQADR